MSADSDEVNSDELVEHAEPSSIISNYRPDDDEAESIHESSDVRKYFDDFHDEVATIINSHDPEVMEEYKEEPGSGEGRDEVDDNIIYELDANTPDVGDAVTAECHSELELNV